MFVAVAAMPVDAPARDIYVHNRLGNDAFDGSSILNQSGRRGAVRSLQRAVDKARPGDRIVVASSGAALREEVVVDGRRQPGGTPVYPIIIEGNGAVLEGLVDFDPTEADNLGGGLFRFEDESGATHTTDWLFVGGKPCPRGMLFTGGQTALGVDHFAVNGGRFFFRSDLKKDLSQYSFAYSKRGCGLSIVRSNHWIIRHLVVRGYRYEGVQIRGPADDIRFEHLRVEANGNAGVAASNLTAGALVDSYIDANGRVGVSAENFAKIRLERVKATGSPINLRQVPGAAFEIIAGEPLPAPPLIETPAGDGGTNRSGADAPAAPIQPQEPIDSLNPGTKPKPKPRLRDASEGDL